MAAEHAPSSVIRRSDWPVVVGFVVLIVGVLWWLSPLAVPPIRQVPDRTHCLNQLRNIELALQNYHSLHGSFPPAITYGPNGESWHSWRVLILPQLDRPDLYRAYRFDEPWDGPNNRKLLESGVMPSVYRCPADVEGPKHHTSYFAVIGERTLWPKERSTRLDDIADPAESTIHVIEVSDSGVPWTEPRDLAFEQMTFSVNANSGVGIRCRHNDANVSLADMHCRRLSPDTPPKAVKSMLLRDDGGPEELP